jgi:hypothetical protein
MSYRVLRRERTASLERDCPECGTRMKGTGELYWDPTGWFIAFLCPQHREVFPVWAPEYAPLIGELTAGIDPQTLPDMTARGDRV